MIGRSGASRPDPVQAAWLYAQMVRWGQAIMSEKNLATSRAVFRPDLYDAVLDGTQVRGEGEPADGVGSFMGPAFDASDIAGHLAAWSIKRGTRPRLSVVR